MVNRSPMAVVTNLIMNPFYQFYHRHDIDISGVILLMFAIMLVVAVYGDLSACKVLNHLPLLRVCYLVLLIPLDSIEILDPYHSPAFDKKHPQELVILGHFQRVPCIWVVFYILSQIPSGLKSARYSSVFFRIKEIKDVDVDSFQGLKRNERSAWVRRWGIGAHLFVFVDG